MDKLVRISARQIEYSKKFGKYRYFYDLLQERPVVQVFFGARGIGKTVAMQQYLAEQQKLGKKVLYISLDSLLISGYRLLDVIENFVDSGGQLVAIDEIHKYPLWDVNLKTIADAFPQLQIIASGSSSLEIRSADLSRRAVKFLCHGLSFREWLNFNNNCSFKSLTLESILKDHSEIAYEIVQQLARDSLSILELFEQYLKIGYFPTSIGLDQNTFFVVIIESIQRAIETDLTAAYPELSGSSTQRLSRFLGIISSKCPYTPNINSLTESLGIKDQKTTKQYLYYLHCAQLIQQIPKFGSSINILKSRKKYFLTILVMFMPCLSLL